MQQPEFQKYEIVEIVQSSFENIVGKKGYIEFMAQDDQTGKWQYGLKVEGKKYGIAKFEKEDIKSTGQFLPEEEIKRIQNIGSFLRVTRYGEVTDVHIANPKTWEEYTLTPDQITGWKEDAAIKEKPQKQRKYVSGKEICSCGIGNRCLGSKEPIKTEPREFPKHLLVPLPEKKTQPFPWIKEEKPSTLVAIDSLERTLPENDVSLEVH